LPQNAERRLFPETKAGAKCSLFISQTSLLKWLSSKLVTVPSLYWKFAEVVSGISRDYF